ncbi:hypothetical protein ACIBFB_13390 [Nocardiopsis sp. NPDC050513]|uniref:hypothetical protein n=1 Tax=Nocardiopsis sp. NPDC050513 TaxID=3364338 RepID=UPI0037A5B1DE
MGQRGKIHSTVSNGVRPVFDPDLPPRVMDRLRENPSSLVRETDTARPWSGHRGKLLVGGLAVAALNLAWMLGHVWLITEATGWYFVGLLVQAVVVAVGGIAALRVTPRTSLPARLCGNWARRGWIWFSLSVLPVTILTWMPGPEGPWLFSVLVWYSPTAVYTAVALWVAFGWTRHERLAVAHVRRYLVAADFDARGADLLVGVQMTVSTVDEAGGRLGASFDTAQPLRILRAEEWRIASTLYRYQRLRAETRAESADAASERVRAVLARQRQQQEAAYRELAAQVDRILEYGAAVEEALRAHTEWEQIERAEARDERIAELNVRASSDSGSAGVLRDEALGAVAARQVRDELIDRALAAGRLLTAEPDHEG